jgi:hypothetical protein
MSRSKRNKRAGGAKNWVMLEHYLLDTPAWRHLTPNARTVYLELKRRYNGRNNGLISYSAREAGDALSGKHHSTGARALLELQEHGFIVVTEDSNFDRKLKLAREYRLTEARDDRPGLEAPPTKEFARWRAPENLEHSRTGEIHSLTHATVVRKRVSANA